MVALEAWYDIDDDEPTAIGDSADLGALLDRMISDGQRFEVPPLVELSHQGTDGWLVAYVGLNAKHGTGFMTHSDPSGSVTSFNGSSDQSPVEYDYMGHQRQVPANAEVPMADVRKAAHELLATGERPDCIAWQADAEGERPIATDETTGR